MTNPRVQPKTRDQPRPLEDRNRDGIPDQYETLLRILGWVGRLIGEPQLRDRIEQQIRAQGAAAAQGKTPARQRAQASPSAAPPKQIRTTTHRPHTSAVERVNHHPRMEGGLKEFMRKLVIVSSVVVAGYVALRLLGIG